MQQFSRSSQAKRVKKKCKISSCNNSPLFAFVKGNTDESPEHCKAMKWPYSNESKESTNIIQPVLDWGSSKTPARSSFQFGDSLVKCSCLSANDVA